MKSYYYLIHHQLGDIVPPVVFVIPFGISEREQSQLVNCLNMSAHLENLYFRIRDEKSTQFARAIEHLPRACHAQISPSDAVAIIKKCYRSYVKNLSNNLNGHPSWKS